MGMMGDRDDSGERVLVKRIPGTARCQIEDSSQVFAFLFAGSRSWHLRTVPWDVRFRESFSLQTKGVKGSQ